jgi:ABC-type nickel/cobalt efflux system permease component RcnA
VAAVRKNSLIAPERGRTPKFEVASGAMVALIGAFLFWRSVRDDHQPHEREEQRTAPPSEHEGDAFTRTQPSSPNVTRTRPDVAVRSSSCAPHE